VIHRWTWISPLWLDIEVRKWVMSKPRQKLGTWIDYWSSQVVTWLRCRRRHHHPFVPLSSSSSVFLPHPSPGVDRPITKRLPMTEHLFICSSYVLHFEWFKMLCECYLKH
jgi:hypothetical protein